MKHISTGADGKRLYIQYEYVDIETGELIRKNRVKNYVKIKSTKKITHGDVYNVITIVIECERNRQGKLFD